MMMVVMIMVVMMMMVMVMMVMMISLQALLYQQDNETVFTVEYDIAKQVRGSHDTFDIAKHVILS